MADTTVRGTYWALTLNNPTEEEVEQFTQAQKAGLAVGQMEIAPTTGTRHLQFVYKTKQTRQSSVKEIWKRAHIEKAKNKFAAMNYCKKDETREAATQTDTDKKKTKVQFFECIALYWDLSAQWIIEDNDDFLLTPKDYNLDRLDMIVKYYLSEDCTIVLDFETQIWLCSCASNVQYRKTIAMYGHVIFSDHYTDGEEVRASEQEDGGKEDVEDGQDGEETDSADENSGEEDDQSWSGDETSDSGRA